MKRNKPTHNTWIRRMYIAFAAYCALVTAAAIITVDTTRRKANDEIRQYHDQAVREIVTSSGWTSGQYPQWFIEWRNTEFYKNQKTEESE